MTERSNTVMFMFPKNARRPTAWEMHEWVHGEYQIPDTVPVGIQLDFIMNAIFLKFPTSEIVDRIVTRSGGKGKFKYLNGKITDITILSSGYGLRTVKVFNVPFECPNEAIKQKLKEFGNVLSIEDDAWQAPFRYKILSGVRTVKIDLKRHIPSYLTIVGNRAFISYSGQPITCSICGSSEHIRGRCPSRRPVQLPRESADTHTYASIVSGGASQADDVQDMDISEHMAIPQGQEVVTSVVSESLSVDDKQMTTIQVSKEAPTLTSGTIAVSVSSAAITQTSGTAEPDQVTQTSGTVVQGQLTQTLGTNTSKQPTQTSGTVDLEQQTQTSGAVDSVQQTKTSATVIPVQKTQT